MSTDRKITLTERPNAVSAPGTYPGEIIRVTVGSEVHGVTAQGSDDHDEMGIFIPPPTQVLGLRETEHATARTAWERTNTGPRSKEQPRSQAGDTDVTLYSLRKYCQLAANGNPSILVLLFVPSQFTLYESTWGCLLRDNRDLFIAKDAGRKFLGYLKAQKERLLGLRGQTVKRPELVEAHGYDTKFAYHAHRLGFQGVELMETGKITLPTKPPDIHYLRQIRNGELTFEQVIEGIEFLDERLYTAYHESKLPALPDYDGINGLLVTMQMTYWKMRGWAR